MNTCPDCNAEMKSLFLANSFYCPNDCDLKKTEDSASDHDSIRDLTPIWITAALLDDWHGKEMEKGRLFTWNFHLIAPNAVSYTKCSIIGKHLNGVNTVAPALSNIKFLSGNNPPRVFIAVDGCACNSCARARKLVRSQAKHE